MRYLFPDGSEAGSRLAAELDAMAGIPQHLWTKEQGELIASIQQNVDRRMKVIEEGKHGRD